MAKAKLTEQEKREIIASIGEKKDPILIAANYDVSVSYVKRLYTESRDVILYKTGSKINKLNLVTIVDPIGYEIGVYKNGSPIVAYVGTRAKTSLTFHSPECVIVGHTIKGKPIKAYVGQGAKKALEEARYSGLGTPFKFVSAEDDDISDLIDE